MLGDKKCFIIITMCFLKHLACEEAEHIFDKKAEATVHMEGPCIRKPALQTVLPPVSESQEHLKIHKINQLLISMYSNNSLIHKISEQIQKCFQQSSADRASIQDSGPIVEERRSKHTLMEALFRDFPGDFASKSFPYKLSLGGKLPQQFFKNRKYSLPIKLVHNSARSSAPICNSNSIDIYIGVFDCEGRWVTENLVHEPIIDGMTSTELYHGKAEFPKLFFHEINNNLPKQKLNIAIYCKPRLERGLGQSCCGGIKWDEVKPLVLKNVRVLSKKRKRDSSYV